MAKEMQLEKGRALRDGYVSQDKGDVIHRNTIFFRTAYDVSVETLREYKETFAEQDEAGKRSHLMAMIPEAMTLASSRALQEREETIDRIHGVLAKEGEVDPLLEAHLQKLNKDSKSPYDMENYALPKDLASQYSEAEQEQYWQLVKALEEQNARVAQVEQGQEIHADYERQIGLLQEPLERLPKMHEGEMSYMVNDVTTAVDIVQAMAERDEAQLATAYQEQAATLQSGYRDHALEEVNRAIREIDQSSQLMASLDLHQRFEAQGEPFDIAERFGDLDDMQLRGLYVMAVSNMVLNYDSTLLTSTFQKVVETDDRLVVDRQHVYDDFQKVMESRDWNVSADDITEAVAMKSDALLRGADGSADIGMFGRIKAKERFDKHVGPDYQGKWDAPDLDAAYQDMKAGKAQLHADAEPYVEAYDEMVAAKEAAERAAREEKIRLEAEQKGIESAERYVTLRGQLEDRLAVTVRPVGSKPVSIDAIMEEDVRAQSESKRRENIDRLLRKSDITEHDRSAILSIVEHGNEHPELLQYQGNVMKHASELQAAVKSPELFAGIVDDVRKGVVIREKGDKFTYKKGDESLSLSDYLKEKGVAKEDRDAVKKKLKPLIEDYSGYVSLDKKTMTLNHEPKTGAELAYAMSAKPSSELGQEFMKLFDLSGAKPEGKRDLVKALFYNITLGQIKYDEKKEKLVHDYEDKYGHRYMDLDWAKFMEVPPGKKKEATKIIEGIMQELPKYVTAQGIDERTFTPYSVQEREQGVEPGRNPALEALKKDVMERVNERAKFQKALLEGEPVGAVKAVKPVRDAFDKAVESVTGRDPSQARSVEGKKAVEPKKQKSGSAKRPPGLPEMSLKNIGESTEKFEKRGFMGRLWQGVKDKTKEVKDKAVDIGKSLGSFLRRDKDSDKKDKGFVERVEEERGQQQGKQSGRGR